jgi:SAM-dependent methyltransferase
VSTPKTRDTDADWRKIGDTEPHWGVITQPEFLSENLTEDNVAAFYASGVDFMAYTVQALRAVTDWPVWAASALDFGCGVGRLTEAMTAYADKVVGYDISPGMLAQARAHGAGKATYVDVLPDGPFDWINSYIVFQHIPPERGMELLRALLQRLKLGGLVSLQFTIYRDAIHTWVPTEGVVEDPRLTLPVGVVSMFDYDLGQLCEAFNRAGILRLVLEHEDQGGHHAVRIYGRKTT